MRDAIKHLSGRKTSVMTNFSLARQRAEALFKPAAATASGPSVFDEIAALAAQTREKTARLRAQRLTASIPAPSANRRHR